MNCVGVQSYRLRYPIARPVIAVKMSLSTVLGPVAREVSYCRIWPGWTPVASCALSCSASSFRMQARTLSDFPAP